MSYRRPHPPGFAVTYPRRACAGSIAARAGTGRAGHRNWRRTERPVAVAGSAERRSDGIVRHGRARFFACLGRQLPGAARSLCRDRDAYRHAGFMAARLHRDAGRWAYRAQRTAAQYALERDVSYLGICLGLQTAVIAAARRAGLDDANSTELLRDRKSVV